MLSRSRSRRTGRLPEIRGISRRNIFVLISRRFVSHHSHWNNQHPVATHVTCGQTWQHLNLLTHTGVDLPRKESNDISMGRTCARLESKGRIGNFYKAQKPRARTRCHHHLDRERYLMKSFGVTRRFPPTQTLQEMLADRLLLCPDPYRMIIERRHFFKIPHLHLHSRHHQQA